MRTYTDRDLRILVACSSVPSRSGNHVPLDLAGANLEMANLPHVDLRGANLQGANLRGAMLWGAILDDACLDDAVLRAHVQSALLSLRKRGAAGFTLSRSDPAFTGDWIAYKARRLQQAQTRVLSDDDLQDLLRWSASTGKPLNLRGCNLSGANLRNASLRGACLAYTDADGADMDGVDLAGADLEHSYGWERH